MSKQDQPAACYQCHADVQAAFAEPVHHKVNEGQMQCSDCHEAHGANGKKDKRAAADWNAVCTKCHTQTAGAFAHEHPVVQTEGCVSCHAPHGSANAHLLTESNVNTLCLQCHSATNASAFPHAVSAAASAHDPATQPAACTSCHTQIHGSNASDIFFQ